MTRPIGYTNRENKILVTRKQGEEKSERELSPTRDNGVFERM